MAGLKSQSPEPEGVGCALLSLLTAHRSRATSLPRRDLLQQSRIHSKLLKAEFREDESLLYSKCGGGGAQGLLAA